MVETADMRESTRAFPRLAEGLEFGPEETAGGSVVAFLPPDRYMEVSSETARVLRLVDGTRDVGTLAALASVELSLAISPEAFRELLDERLVPRGLVCYGEPAPAPARARGRPRVRFLPTPAVGAVARALGFLYWRPVAAIAVIASVGAQAWFFLTGAGTGAAAEPSIVPGWLAVVLCYMASMLAHEIGHAAALQRFGIAPGAIGIDATRGLPRWGTDVSGMWKLRRLQRVVVDLGGVYFQSLVVAALILLRVLVPVLVSGSVLAWVVAIVDMVILFCLVPHGRSDGFWLAADLAGTRYPRIPSADVPAGPEAPGVPGRARREHRLARVLRSLRMDIQAAIRLRAGRRKLEDAYELLPVFIATSIGADVPPRRLRAHVRSFLHTHAVMRLEHERLPSGARCDDVHNAGPLLDLARRGQGVMVCSLHYGPYFYVGSELLALGVDVNLVSASAMIRRQDGMWSRVAQVHGRRLDLLRVERLSGTRSILRILEGGGLVLIYGDGQGGLDGSRSSKSHRTTGSFLSMPIRMWTGPATLAQRAGAHVVFAIIQRERWGRRILEFSDPRQVPAADGDQAPATFTQDMYRWFDPRARRHPEHWAGWGLPHLFLGETGAAPRATVAALERECQRVAELLRAPAGRTRLRAEPTRVAFVGEGDRYALIDGPTRRVLEVDGLTAAVLGAAYRGVPLERLRRDVCSDVARLSDVVAHLTLADLARLEGPGVPTAGRASDRIAGPPLPAQTG
jgi:lauroyl/myristoyl acyltransferase